jgi:purine-binding chemotaxis protein CheW
VEIPSDAVLLELACFAVGGQEFAIDVRQVREIVRAQQPMPLPSAPPLVEGVIDLRGSVIPVVDLGRALVGEPVDAPERARIAVVETEGLVFGLRVEAAVDVVAVDPGAVAGPPALAAAGGDGGVRAIVRREGKPPLAILSLEHLLERVRRSARDAAAPVAVKTPRPAGKQGG